MRPQAYGYFLVGLLGAAAPVGVIALPNTASAQQWEEADPATALPRALRRNVVTIRAEWNEDEDRSDGFGFITGVRDGYTYVATANHVVRGYEGDSPADKLTVRFFRDRKPRPAELIDDHDAGLDIAAIRIKGEPSTEWFAAASGQHSRIRRGMSVWFIGRGGTWYIPARPGSLNDLDPEMGLIMEGLSIAVGTSGAPLLSEAGIVGLMTSDASGDLSRACPISRVAEQFAGWKLPWSIVPTSPKATPKSLRLPGSAYQAMARLALHLGRDKEAAAAALAAVRRAPEDEALAYWVLEQIVTSPESSCFVPNYFRSCGDFALKRAASVVARRLVKDADKIETADQLGYLVRVMRIVGNRKTRDATVARLARLGRTRFPKAHWFAAEVGLDRARKGDASGLALLDQALAARPEDPVYATYKSVALIALKRPVEAGEWLLDHPLGSGQSAHQREVCKQMTDLLPTVEADKKGQQLPYARLKAMRDAFECRTRNPRQKLLTLLITLRTEGEQAATDSLDVSDRPLKRLFRDQRSNRSPDEAEAATRLLRLTHRLLAQADKHPRARFFIEQLGRIEGPPASPAVVLRHPRDQRPTFSALTEPPTHVLESEGYVLRRWRIKDQSVEQWVDTDSAICALAASANGREVAFVTEDGAGYVWTKKSLVRLGGKDKLSCLVAVAADGRSLAAMGPDNTFLRWSVAKASRPPATRVSLPWEPKSLSLSKKRAFAAKDAAVFAAISFRGKGKVRPFGCGPKTGEVIAIDARSRQVAAVAHGELRICKAPSGKVVTMVGYGDDEQGAFFDNGRKLGMIIKSRRQVVDIGRAKGRWRALTGEREGIRNSGRLEISEDGSVWLRSNRYGSSKVITAAGADVQKRSFSDKTEGRVFVDSMTDTVAVLNMDRNKRSGSGLTVPALGSGRSVGCKPEETRWRWKWTRTLPIVLRQVGMGKIKLDGRPCESIPDLLTLDEPSKWSRFVLSPSLKLRAWRKRSSVLVRQTMGNRPTADYDCGFKSTSSERGIAFSPDDQRLVAVGARRTCVVDLATGKVRAEPFKSESGQYTSRATAVSADGKTAAVLYASGNVRRLDLDTLKSTAFPGPLSRNTRSSASSAIVIEPEDTLLTLSRDGMVIRWDAQGLPVAGHEVGTSATGLGIASDGRKVHVPLKTSDYERSVLILDRRTLKPTATLAAFPNAGLVAYTPQGACWATDGSAKSIMPDFVVRSGQPKRNRRACKDRKVLAALKSTPRKKR